MSSGERDIPTADSHRASVTSAHHPTYGLWRLRIKELSSGDSTSSDIALALPTSQQGEKLTSGGRRLPKRTAYTFPIRGSTSCNGIGGVTPPYQGSPLMQSFASGEELDAFKRALMSMSDRSPTSFPRSKHPRTDSLRLGLQEKNRRASCGVPYGSASPTTSSPVEAGLVPRMQSLQLGGRRPPSQSSSSRALVTSPQAPMDGLTLRRMGIPTRESASSGIALALPASQHGRKLTPGGRVLPKRTASLLPVARGVASCSGIGGGTPPYQGSPLMRSFASGEELDSFKTVLVNMSGRSPTSCPRSKHPRTDSLRLGWQGKSRRASCSMPYGSILSPPSSSPVKAGLPQTSLKLGVHEVPHPVIAVVSSH
eukprot:gene8166-1421_t